MMLYPMNSQLMHKSSMTGETIVVSGIPGHVSERDLEETVISILSDIEVNVYANDVEACHRIGKTDRNK